jgi:hypothetical protein
VAGEADTVLAGEFDDLGDEVGHLVHFSGIADMGGEFGEGIGGRGSEMRTHVADAEKIAGMGDRMAAVTTFRVDVSTEGKRIDDFSRR